eukprot:scaffold247210_cov46-Prasinocladus_malaysianus.AAC.1
MLIIVSFWLFGLPRAYYALECMTSILRYQRPIHDRDGMVSLREDDGFVAQCFRKQKAPWLGDSD